MKFSERKVESFYQELLPMIQALTFTPVETEDGFVEQAWLGTIFGCTPSGKYYTFWTTNGSPRERLLDSWWWEALELALQKQGYWQGSSEDESIFIERPVREGVVYCPIGQSPTIDNIWQDRAFPKDWYEPSVPDDYEEHASDEVGNAL